jgi:crotonobetainyl-CoA:carnitine CoA-transferase CaiB-like acyl-CoA transferase
MSGALDGIVVVERAGRLAGAAAAGLLAELGATVIRVEHSGPATVHEPAAWREHPLATAGKTRIALADDPAEAARQWDALCRRADVVIHSPPLPAIADDPDGPIRCDISAFGIAGTDDLPDDCGEAILQAAGGGMGTTGALNGPPELAGAPLVELATALNAATSVAAALRVRDAGGPAQRIDLSAFDSSIALVGAFTGQMQVGEGHGLRAGACHVLCAPWSAYPTKDGWVLMCSSTEPHWERIRALIGREDLADDPRFVDMATRVINRPVVDAAVMEWTQKHSTAEAVTAFKAATIPAGPILTIPERLAPESGLPTRMVAMPDGAPAVHCPDTILKMDKTPGHAAEAVAPVGHDMDALLARLAERARTTGTGTAAQPLAGIRVIEIGVFTAGPLGSRYLADLGAEVIKVEQPGGENGRVWNPNFGGISGYFSSNNAGKRSVTLDLRTETDRAGLESLIASADVLLQNLKAGALDRLGFGPAETRKRHPRLIYCSVSGYGATGAQLPALDTVIQAESGLMSLIGDAGDPIKVGVSIADLLASHLSPLLIMMALRHREHSGEGQHVDISMLETLAWTTQLSWATGKPALPECAQITCADGWVVAEAPADAIRAAIKGVETETRSCTDMLDRLRAAGLAAAKVLELDDLRDHPLVRERGLLVTAGTPGGVPAPVLGCPYALTLTPPRLGATVEAAGAANGLIEAAAE